MKIKNNAVIVTGGASGLGAATAEMITAHGGNVVIADMNVEAGQALAKKLGTPARFIECDVTKGRPRKCNHLASAI
jgi:NAD(P)-dependent dehydrogenase (short-subunit alcohol dehydrogenase family)